MSEDAGVAQARLLLTALYAQITEISRKLETAEMRGLRVSARGALHDRREQSQLRRDLYEAHHLVDGLHRRFPETLPPTQLGHRRQVFSAGQSRR
jgi:hypothetical protein